MSEDQVSPTIYRDNPDALSVLLARLALKAEVYVDGDFCGTWAVDTAGSRRIPFHLIVEGNAWLHFPESTPRALKRRDLVVFPQDAHHVIASSPESPAADSVNAPMSNDGDTTTRMVCGFFEFSSPALFPVLKALPEVVLLEAAKNSVDDRAGRLVDMMLEELRNDSPGAYAAIDQMASLLFIQVLREAVTSGTLTTGLIVALSDPHLGRALTAIHTGPEESWTVDSLASRAAMSRSSFSSRFADVVGYSPMKYLTLWRMSEAQRMLCSTTMSTAQIAQQCGYESEAAFRKAFKQIVGETPAAVRKKGLI